MRNIDFSSWQGALTTFIGLVLVSLVAVGIRLVFMQTVQQRRERANRQINERLKTLIAAYKTLGGSFTGDLAVHSIHLRELRRVEGAEGGAGAEAAGSDRRRRIRDAVEAALSDIILLGTPEQVALAAAAANDMVAGRNVETAALVVSLRNFIRDVLDLDAVPVGVSIPKQGPLRPAGGGPQRAARGDRAGGANAGAKGGGQRGGGGGGTGGGLSIADDGAGAADGAASP